VEFEASALNRRTKQSPACTMPLGSGVTPMVPGSLVHEVIVPLKYGVALSGLPMIGDDAADRRERRITGGRAAFQIPDHERPG